MSASATEGLPSMPTPRSGVLAVLQRIARSLMMPIAVLPAAAILLRFGQPDLLGRFNETINFGVLAAAGNALLSADILPLLFAVGVAIGFARRSDGSTALAAVVGYLVFDAVTMAMFAGSSLRDQVLTTPAEVTQPELASPKPNPTGVFGGIVVGIAAAMLYTRYYRIKLPMWLAFFGGRRFVPIITALAAVVLGVVFGFVWPPIGQGIQNIGEWLTDAGAIGAGVYGAINRTLLPFGLHHIVNSLVWFVFGEFQNAAGEVSRGDLTRFFAGDPEAGVFMAGWFPVMMFGLPAAAMAMWRHALPGQRAAIGGTMIAFALTSLITGVTEPIEYSFLFAAPLLYGVHVVLSGVSLWLANALDIHLGFGFSAGLTDYALNFTAEATSRPLLLLLIGAVYAVVYYALFSFCIKRFNLMTPGRDPEAEMAEDITQRQAEQQQQPPPPTTPGTPQPEQAT